MAAVTDAPVRAPSVLDFAAQAPAREGALARRTARAQNFSVTWLDASGDARFAWRSPDESMVIVLGAAASVETANRTEAPARSLAIVPAGDATLHMRAGGTCIVLQSLRAGVNAGAMNEAAYATPDARIVDVGTPYRALGRATEVRILPIDQVMASKDRPRLKMVQTATLSINWVEYEGPRNRTQLSPHAHSNFEQGSLAVAGDFEHHLRVQWGENADLWQDDRHAKLGSPSLLVVPVGLIHTSEGVGPGRHLLIDIFSPPRADFIANGWVANAADYAAPAK